MDRLSKEQRSRNMAAVHGKETKPELKVRSAVHSNGFRFSVHRKDLPGKPDLVLPKYGIVIFVHGCFWHGHDCPRGKRPVTRKQFWDKKLSNNKQRDAQNLAALDALGWRVFVIWECSLAKDTAAVIKMLKRKRASKAHVA